MFDAVQKRQLFIIKPIRISAVAHQQRESLSWKKSKTGSSLLRATIPRLPALEFPFGLWPIKKPSVSVKYGFFTGSNAAANTLVVLVDTYGVNVELRISLTVKSRFVG